MRAKDENKELLILEAALKMIARIGLAGLKMSDLAKEAHVATGTLYIYFKDKEELIRKLYLYLLRKSSEEVIKDISTREPLKKRVNKICYNLLINNLLYPENGAFFEQYFRSPFFHETESVLAEENMVMQPFYNLIIEGQQHGIVKETDPELLVTLICGMLETVAKVAFYSRKSISDIEWDTIFGIIWDGIKS
ncbi:TetR/AcrR family transcriptional regulator [Emticicia sp. BO119]|uniref:TetR/AcrR family transcriptional regulator n=1 Tax=Emticicia sp. BO119 TaxID=2757768 RepID=UPI0015F09D76|nr:TetR/AcrR family transcriptional regulator [Emticicia sp. BO119]MBA4851838.1 TetR/AcrR family transcriptional regulator [Emticicia sp. BO119]